MQRWKQMGWWTSTQIRRVEKALSKIEDLGNVIVPDPKLVYEPLRRTEFKDVKVAIFAEAPIPIANYNDGLAFSVLPHIKRPKSITHLINEYCRDLGYPKPSTGSLRRWADNGVLLWNAIPTTSAGRKPRDHKDVGWHGLTWEILWRLIHKKKHPVVFIMIGKLPKKLDAYINKNLDKDHLFMYTSYNALEGSGIFSKANDFLLTKGVEPVDWRLY